jgi:hypothetical protein
MPELSHQTVRLSRGRHGSPALGMCVMELASTLAGERFSDHPRSVSPVIAGLLRQYNDAVDDQRRQALIPYAALAVGTRSSKEAERARARRCVEWAAERSGARLPRWRSALARVSRLSACGAWAAECARGGDEQDLAQLRGLLDELIGAGGTATIEALPPRAVERQI